MQAFFGLPSYTFPKFGTPLTNWRFFTPRSFSETLADKLTATGCWSDYNTHYRYYNFLDRLGNSAPFFRRADLPLPPDPDDYANLKC